MQGVTCTACPANEASTEDRLSCLPCNVASTAGSTLFSDGDCSCLKGNYDNYIEEYSSVTGALLSSKSCSTCPDKSGVVIGNQWIAGGIYTLNLECSYKVIYKYIYNNVYNDIGETVVELHLPVS